MKRKRKKAIKIIFTLIYIITIVVVVGTAYRLLTNAISPTIIIIGGTALIVLIGSIVLKRNVFNDIKKKIS